MSGLWLGVSGFRLWAFMPSLDEIWGKGYRGWSCRVRVDAQLVGWTFFRRLEPVLSERYQETNLSYSWILARETGKSAIWSRPPLDFQVRAGPAAHF